MSNIEKFKEFFQKFGMELKQDWHDPDPDAEIGLDLKENKTVICDYASIKFIFSPDGKFLRAQLFS